MVVDLSNLIVNMHEGALDVLQRLDPVLQHHSHVVALAQRRLGRHHDLNFDQEALAEVVGAHRVHFLDALVVMEDDVRQPADEVVRRGEACQFLNVFACCGEPRANDPHGDEDRADWVERRQTLRLPPRQCDRSDTDTVGEHVVEMILCVGLARGRVETGGHRATVYQGEQLAEYGATENGERDRPQVQLVLVAFADHGDQALGRLDDDLEGRHAHDDREHNDSDWLEPRLAFRKFVRIDACHGALRRREDNAADQVKQRVSQRGEDRHGAGGNHGDQLGAEQRHVQAE
mmetsp:Transcript_17424/g.47162  ORF Transcript_17424/g.47162 Transcript_17424/m.47162 type:complete len:289 (-) Transcript_17424:437-1303(-)